MYFDYAHHYSPNSHSLEESCWHALSLGVIALLILVGAQTFFTVGGVDAKFLVFSFGILTIAVSTQILAFGMRLGHGVPFGGLTALFVPWFLAALADSLFFSETPWRSRYLLCLSLLPVMAFFATSHAARTTRTRWWLISAISALTLFSGLAEFLQPAQDTLEDIGGGSIGESVRTIFGSLGNTAGIGAALLLVFFPMATLGASPRFPIWARMFGGYSSVIFFAGIAATRHAGVYLGFFAGSALAVCLLVHKKWQRLSLLATIAVAAVIFVPATATNIGVFKTVPVTENLKANFSEEELGAGTKYLLPHAAIEMFKEHPIVGVGGGCFATEFEKYRTPQWQTNPMTAGSLYLTLLAERGLLGLLTLLVPAGAFAFLAVRACWKMPWREDTESARLRRKMGFMDFGALPEERATLASILAGIFAVSVLFAVDYPCSIPGISIAIGIFGGIAAFLTNSEWRREVVWKSRRRFILIPLAALFPVVMFAFFLPIFRAESEWQKGEELLKPFYTDIVNGVPADRKNLDYKNLALAESHLRAALRKTPDHGDAWNALSKKYILDCQRDPAATARFGLYIDETSTRALETSSVIPDFYQKRAAANLIAGEFSEASKNLKKAEELAPFNAPEILERAEIFCVIPGGVSDATRLISRLVAIVPNSDYILKLHAISTLESSQNKASDDGKKSTGGEIIIPEF